MLSSNAHPMKWFSLAITVFVFTSFSFTQTQSSSAAKNSVSGASVSGSTIALHATSTMNVASEMGGAFMSGSKCDADGNLYIRKFASDRPLRGPVVKIDPDGKRIGMFDPAAFSQLALDRADGFSPLPGYGSS